MDAKFIYLEFAIVLKWSNLLTKPPPPITQPKDQEFSESGFVWLDMIN